MRKIIFIITDTKYQHADYADCADNINNQESAKSVKSARENIFICTQIKLMTQIFATIKIFLNSYLG